MTINNNSIARKIRRQRTGCNTCKHRGKKCDEGKPVCGACSRLRLLCEYGKSFTFYRSRPDLPRSNPDTQLLIPEKPTEKSVYDPITQADVPGWDFSPKTFGYLQAISDRELSLGPVLRAELRYFQHFDKHVRHIFPGNLEQASIWSVDCAPLKYAILCITASNLAVLEAPGQSKMASQNAQSALFGSNVNKDHYSWASKYLLLANQNMLAIEEHENTDSIPLILVAKVFLAHFHHASTDHLRFRLAVWDTVQFVLKHQDGLMNLPVGRQALQLWHRLCVAHRPSKPPPLLIEGEGRSIHSPNLSLPNSNDYLYHSCLIHMTSNDLIYDILVKTIELQNRVIVHRCTAFVHEVSEQSQNISHLAIETLNQMIRKSTTPLEQAEANLAYVTGHHLYELISIQKERLKLWQSQIAKDQNHSEPTTPRTYPNESGCTKKQLFMQKYDDHTAKMNAVYSHLCYLIYDETHGHFSSKADDQNITPSIFHQVHTTQTLQALFDAINNLDFSQSNYWDVYTFSLTEVLLQLVYICKSENIFHRVQNEIWAQIETCGRGYEHSHIPTHLAKRMVALVANEWRQGRSILHLVPVINEDTPKTTLMSLDFQPDMIAYGCDDGGKYYIRRLPLA